MKSIKLFLLLFAVSGGTVSLFAQTAEEIIAKHIDATGGKEKLASINSVRTENTITIMGGDSPATITILNGKGYRNESDFNGQKIISVYTDKSGWAVNPFAGATEPAAMPDAQYKAGQDQIYIAPLLNYTARGDKAELVGKEKLGNVEAYKVKITNHNNIVNTYYFDPTTYYLLQVVSTADFMGQPIDMKVNFSDFKKTDFGTVLAYTTDIDFGGQFQLTSKINKVEVNGTVDPSVFDMK